MTEYFFSLVILRIEKGSDPPTQIILREKNDGYAPHFKVKTSPIFIFPIRAQVQYFIYVVYGSSNYFFRQMQLRFLHVALLCHLNIISHCSYTQTAYNTTYSSVIYTYTLFND